MHVCDGLRSFRVVMPCLNIICQMAVRLLDDFNHFASSGLRGVRYTREGAFGALHMHFRSKMQIRAAIRAVW